MSTIVELFGIPTDKPGIDWKLVTRQQQCPFLGKKCYKVRKSEPETAIGSCTVLQGKWLEPTIICPTRLIENRQVFTDCFHLLTTHEPGNELHIVSEVSVPGGSVDYFLVSARSRKVRDFVGIELQTLDTTGTVWPERQRLLRELGATAGDDQSAADKAYGMTWKMTAKTILVQMHHKIDTFEHIGKKLVLILQDRLLDYMSREFDFDHLTNPAVIGHSMHIHAYRLDRQSEGTYRLGLTKRLSTDSEGIEKCLGLRVESRVDLELILAQLQSKISNATLFAGV